MGPTTTGPVVLPCHRPCSRVPAFVRFPSSPLQPPLADTGEPDHVTRLELAENSWHIRLFFSTQVGIGLGKGKGTFIRLVRFRLEFYFVSLHL